MNQKKIKISPALSLSLLLRVDITILDASPALSEPTYDSNPKSSSEGATEEIPKSDIETVIYI